MKEEVKLIETTQDDVAVNVINFMLSNNYDQVEILLPDLDDKQLDVFAKFLIENDCSIGLLTKRKDFEDAYSDIIGRYGLTYGVLFPRQTKSKRHSDDIRLEFGPILKESCSLDEHRPTKQKPISFKKSKYNTDGLKLDESFNTRFIRLLNESGKSNVEDADYEVVDDDDKK